MKIGLYSISYLGVWYDGPALSFEEFVKRAKDYGYAGIELDGKRPHGNPMDLDAANARPDAPDPRASRIGDPLRGSQ